MDIKDVFKGTLVVLFTLLGAYILLIGSQIIVTLLIAIIIASAVRPIVNLLTRFKLPESVAIVMVYATIIITIIVIVFVLVPPMFNQLAVYIEQDWRLASRLIYAQQVVERYISDFTNNDDISLVTPDQIRTAASTGVERFRSIMPTLLQNLGNIALSAVLIFVMGAYWLTSHIEAKRFLLRLSPPNIRDEVRTVITEIEGTLGSYVRGVVIIASAVGVLNFIPMQLFGVPNALALSFIIATLTIVPMIGGVIGGAIATMLTLITDPPLAIVVMIIFLIVNQIEAYILQPRIMSDEVGMNPLLVIIYTSIGFALYGVIGALIAVPIMGSIHILLEHMVIQPHQKSLGDTTPPEEIVVEVEEAKNIKVTASDKKAEVKTDSDFNRPVTEG